MAKIPQWANDLAARVCAANNIPIPAIVWRRYRKQKIRAVTCPRSEFSSGHANVLRNRIVVSAGSSQRDQKLVLLHELAHILCPKHGHDRVFWAKVWELYRTYGVPIRYALERESHYRGSRAAYLASIARPCALRPKPTAVEKSRERLHTAQEKLATWMRKLALAKTKVRKYTAKVRRLNQSVACMESA